MAHREFIDGSGTRWEVWVTVPTKPERRQQPPAGVAPAVDRRVRREYRVPMEKRWINGWLTFRRGTETWRLAPFPSQWANLSDAQLVILADLAEPIKRTSGEHSRDDLPGDGEVH